VLGIKRHLQVDTKASHLLMPLVVATATTDASKIEITTRSPLIEPELILIFQAFLEMREWMLFPLANLHEDNIKHGTDICIYEII